MSETLKNKSGWRWLRRILITLAVLATLVAIFYAEEDWRGKHDWENCKRNLEAKGEVLDWDKFIPPPVPDDQNFFTASTNILLKFKKVQTDAEAEAVRKISWLDLDPFQSNHSTLLFPVLDTSKTAPIVVAQIIVSPKKSLLESGSNILGVALNDHGAPEHVQNLIRAIIGKTISGAQGFEFSQFQWTNLQPAQIFIQADTPPSVTDLAAFIPSNTIGEKGRLQVMGTVDPKIFQVQLTKNVRITAAADYLAWSDQFIPAFDEIRDALKRPYAIIPGDYSVPYMIPIPNFVIMRSVAQTLAQRAQCDFLLGRPEDALREVTLMHDLCRILEKPPTGKPITLVEAMINVAISGLYASTVAEGFRLNAWHEPQIVVLQAQFKAINLTATVHDSLASEQAATTCTIEKTPASKIAELFGMVDVASGTNKPSFWKKIKNPMYLFFKLCPRGWIYQNMITTASYPRSEDGVDLEHETISPQFIEKANRDLEKSVSHATPFNVWARIAIPNFTKAWQTTAHNQTLVNEAQIVCALERYRLAHGEYPETLDALTPQFIETIPHDIIGGQQLHYRGTDDGKFLLYSVGWNETDDGGQEISPPTIYSTIDFTKGDWVWKN